MDKLLFGVSVRVLLIRVFSLLFMPFVQTKARDVVDPDIYTLY